MYILNFNLGEVKGTIFSFKVVTISARINTNIQNLQKLQGYIFQALQHFCNQTL